jgi:hypothetical protein
VAQLAQRKHPRLGRTNRGCSVQPRRRTVPASDKGRQVRWRGFLTPTPTTGWQGALRPRAQWREPAVLLNAPRMATTTGSRSIQFTTAVARSQ